MKGEGGSGKGERKRKGGFSHFTLLPSHFFLVIKKNVEELGI